MLGKIVPLNLLPRMNRKKVVVGTRMTVDTVKGTRFCEVTHINKRTGEVTVTFKARFGYGRTEHGNAFAASHFRIPCPFLADAVFVYSRANRCYINVETRELMHPWSPNGYYYIKN